MPPLLLGRARLSQVSVTPDHMLVFSGEKKSEEEREEGGGAARAHSARRARAHDRRARRARARRCQLLTARPLPSAAPGQAGKTRSTGVRRFRHVLRLPDVVNEEGINAKVEHGVLRITMPKAPERVVAPARDIPLA
jgi:HSP20 family molecular chaperone IbpA